MRLALIFVGGAVGTALRHGMGMLIDGGPIGNLSCNLLGAFLLGFVLATLGRATSPRAAEARLLVGTGMLGAFTTYSGMVVALATTPLPSAWWSALASLLLGVPLAGLGLALGSPRRG